MGSLLPCDLNNNYQQWVLKSFAHATNQWNCYLLVKRQHGFIWCLRHAGRGIRRSENRWRGKQFQLRAADVLASMANLSTPSPCENKLIAWWMLSEMQCLITQTTSVALSAPFLLGRRCSTCGSAAAGFASPSYFSETLISKCVERIQKTGFSILSWCKSDWMLHTGRRK